MVNKSASRFISGSRGYVFEMIIFFIEMGKRYLILCDLLIACFIYIVFGFSNILTLIPLMIVPPIIFFAIFTLQITVGAFFDPLNLSSNGPDWNNEKLTGIKFNKGAGEELKKLYAGKKIPMETFVEYYLNEHIELILPTIDIFLNRYDLFTFTITFGHYKWFFGTFLKQLTGHTVQQDHREVGDVYNRGNDFYNWFLGESMVYTSGIFHDYQYKKESLEEAQINKLKTVCETVQLKKGEEHLDIGCGWGTLVIYAAEHYGTNSTGVTLAKEQVAYAQSRVNKDKKELSDRIHWIVDDYRKIPLHTNNKKYDKITCIEMAEHVGIKNFQPFLTQVREMLKDDGLFYLQMCGLRRSWHFEDVVWILFMGKYIFPGADASTPINFVVQQLERAGFEIHRLESLGCHYGRTIQLWHENWVENKKKVIDKYGQWWYRLWDIFLAWSSFIGKQHTSSVYMITANKNSYCDEESVGNKFNKDQELPKLNRSKLFIGPKLISYQQ